MESPTIATQFVFCKTCGLQQVCDVAEELQRLFSERQLDPNTCAICRKELKETSNGTDVHLKLEQINETSTRNSKLRQSDANHQSDSDTENYALTAEDGIQPSDSVEPDNETTQVGESNLPSNSSIVIKEEMLDDTVIVSLKHKTSSEEQAEPVVKKLKGYQKKTKRKSKKPVRIDQNHEVVQTSPDGPREMKPQRSATRLRTGVVQAAQYTDPRNDEFSTDEEELGDIDWEANSDESGKELGDKCEEKTKKQGRRKNKDLVLKRAFTDGSTDSAIKQLFKCDSENCEATFSTRNYLKRHQKRLHCDQKVRQCICHICGAVLCDKSKVTCHIREVHLYEGKTKPFKCSFCDQRFVYNSQKRRHENLIHIRVKKYVCEVCGRSFKENYKLTRHRLSHTGEKPFACELCDYRCSRKDHLTQHERVHTGERPYSCDLCGLRFANASGLISHNKHNHKAGAVPEEVLSKSEAVPHEESKEMLMNQLEPTATFVPPSEPRGTWSVHDETSFAALQLLQMPHHIIHHL